jgi:DNA-3-methyladenine glycosylase
VARSGETVLSREFFAGDARDVARSLLGMLLVRPDGRKARLVEVEAYLGEDDPGSHAFRGPTPRAQIMFGPCGRLYVYFSYGAHWCANVVCGPEGVASAVLFRAARPVGGVAAIKEARWHGQRQLRERDLCRGPGRLCEGFGITGADNGLDLTAPTGPLWLADDGTGAGGEILVTPRVGLSKGADLPLRYVLAGSPWVSGGLVPARPAGTASPAGMVSTAGMAGMAAPASERRPPPPPTFHGPVTAPPS